MWSINSRGSTPLLRSFVCLAAILCASRAAQGQTASLHGRVFDESGAVIPNATVTLTKSGAQVKGATTSDDGSYFFSGLMPGQYTVQASAPHLEQSPTSITLKKGTQTLRLELKVAATQQQLTVRENSGPVLTAESANNASPLF